jgi:hypothetical protein
MKKIPITNRLSTDRPGRILIDTRKNRRSWVALSNKKYRTSISRALTSYARTTKMVWSYLVIDSDSPPISGFRSASYSSAGNRETLMATAFNDFMQEMSQKLERLTMNSMANIQPIRDQFKITEQPLREIAEVQFGTGKYRWTPFVKSPGISV